MTGKSDILYLKVDAEHDDKRLDRWLRIKLGKKPQSWIETLCRTRRLNVNGIKVKASARVFSGDIVSVPSNSILKNEKTEGHRPRQLTVTDVEMIKSLLIYEDEYLIVLNKPSGLATQGGTHQKNHIDRLITHFATNLSGKPRLVHRLDKDTSGVLVLAKNSKMAALLSKSFRDRHVRKVYWALVAGKPPLEKGFIDFPLVKLNNTIKGLNLEKVKCLREQNKEVVKNAKEALTNYIVIESIEKRLCWLALSPITGRTHQLRAHLSEINCPIIGDSKYGRLSQKNKENKENWWGNLFAEQVINRLHLHARSIEFMHPATNQRLLIEAKLPTHMENSWAALGLNSHTASVDPFS